MMYKLIAEPAQEPITLAEAKAFARIDVSDDDAIITELITRARKFIEEMTSLALFDQTWDCYLDEMPTVLRFHVTPLKSVTGLYYTDVDGSEFTEDAAHYIADTYGDRLIMKQDEVYEGYTYARNWIGWRVRFQAGETSYPEWSKDLTKRLVAFMYDNRDEEISPALMSEIARHKVWYL